MFPDWQLSELMIMRKLNHPNVVKCARLDTPAACVRVCVRA